MEEEKKENPFEELLKIFSKIVGKNYWYIILVLFALLSNTYTLYYVVDLQDDCNQYWIDSYRWGKINLVLGGETVIVPYNRDDILFKAITNITREPNVTTSINITDLD